MKEAHDHHRVTPEGKNIGKRMARIADAECANLARDGEPDERCKSCAFRAGTVPNGCIQTQSDVMKAVAENVPFLCHQIVGTNERLQAICHGWFAVRRVANRREKATGEKLPKCGWDFSPPDEVKP